MIFVDTNVIMYAVGRPHPLRARARDFFERSLRDQDQPLATSAEVLQELLHAYVPAGRLSTFDSALNLAEGIIETVWSVESSDVALARSLATKWPALSARDLIHLACCERRGVRQVMTFDRALATAFSRARGR